MTGPCTAHVWLLAVARCNTCGDSLCSHCRADLGGIDGTSRCIDCAGAELVAAVDRRTGWQKLFRRKPKPAALVAVEPIAQPLAPELRPSSEDDGRRKYRPREHRAPVRTTRAESAPAEAPPVEATAA